MFDWLRKGKRERPEESEAYKLGQQAFQSMAADLEVFVESRFNPTFHATLNVLRECFEGATATEGKDAPPLMQGRVEYQVFLENAREIRPKILAEALAAMSIKGWLDVMAELGMSDHVLTLVESRVDRLISDLEAAGLSLFLDYAHTLKWADDRWRAENPALATKYPPDT